MKLAIGYGIAAAVGLLPGLTAAAAPATTGLPANWAYKGCYSELLFSATGPRMINYNLSREYSFGASSCIGYCAGINPNYRYAATNDNQCWCDVKLNVGADYGIKLGEGNCTKVCRKNPNEICGNEKGKNNSDGSAQYANLPTAASVWELTPVSGFPYACVLVLCAFFVLVGIFLWIGYRQKRKDRMEGRGGGQAPRPYERLENGSSRTACKGGVDEEDGLLKAAGRDSETQSGAAGWGRRFGRSSLFR